MVNGNTFGSILYHHIILYNNNFTVNDDYVL